MDTSRPMNLTWDQLLCDYLMPREGEVAAPSLTDDYRTAFEADHDRVVFSAPFRRLARKTQVHPLAPNDHVHNRLTHSIEVASVGRSFARRLGHFLVTRNQIDPRRAEDLCQIVQSACLAHDIGNPPFGHAGEFAVREWVRVHQAFLFGPWANADRPGTESVGQGVRQDWARFEGNAQGFRLAARTDNPHTGYMRLTFATLSTMIKYPWDSCDPRAGQTHKYNVFSTEREMFLAMSDRMGLLRDDGTVARHPLSFLSEAADDICYRILDLEDAVAMAILDDKAVREVFCGLLGRPTSDKPLSALRGQVIRVLVDGCWDVFERDYESIMAGRRTEDLKAGLPESITEGLARIKALYTTIFAHRGKVATELGAYETLGRIIETLVQAVQELARHCDFDATDFLTRRRLELAWGEAYARRHQDSSYEWWLHQVMDYVAGLTDNFARQLSREIAGV